MKVKILLITNLPTPYKIDFYNELCNYVDLTVIFEAKSIKTELFNWYNNEAFKFQYFFLSDDFLDEKTFNPQIFKYIFKKFDEIIFTCYHTKTESIIMLFFRMISKKYCFSTDGGFINKRESWFKKKIKSFIINGAKLHFSPSLQTDKYLKYYSVPDSKIHRYPFTSLKSSDILPEGLSSDDKNIIRAQYGLSKSTKLIISVGQLIYRKGFDILIKALDRVTVPYQLVIIGAGDNSIYSSLIGNKNVKFLEFKSKVELQNLYKCSDLFILPTREDIWGLVINEAMANSLPVITTDCCIAGLELLDNDFIISIEDESKLPELINAYLSDEVLLKKIGISNLLKISNYTTEKMALKFKNILLNGE